MKILILLVTVVLALGQGVRPANSVGSGGAITTSFVQAATTTSGGINIPINGVVPGDMLVAYTSWTSADTITSCTGTGANWVVGPQTFDAVPTVSVGSCYALNVSGGNLTVTFTFSGSDVPRGSFVLEYSGVAPFNAVDGTTSNINSGNQTVDGTICGAIPTTANGDLITALVLDTSTPGGPTVFSAGTGYTLRVQRSGGGQVIDVSEEDLTESVSGPITPTFTSSNNDRNACIALALKHA